MKSIRKIKGFPNYEIDVSGHVWSNNKKDWMKVYESKSGYLFLRLSKDNKYHNFRVHRLVAITYLENPKNLPCVNHKDGNKRNNHIGNLEWCSWSDNEKHSFDVLGKQPWNKGKKQGYIPKMAFKKGNIPWNKK